MWELKSFESMVIGILPIQRENWLFYVRRGCKKILENERILIRENTNSFYHCKGQFT